ncbi:MAG: hypothetical protein HYX69_21235 [Planctomycetia bacterium]|nr:hypothetical protein [Planctomycetia bacterium]
MGVELEKNRHHVQFVGYREILDGFVVLDRDFQLGSRWEAIGVAKPTCTSFFLVRFRKFRVVEIASQLLHSRTNDRCNDTIRDLLKSFAAWSKLSHELLNLARRPGRLLSCSRQARFDLSREFRKLCHNPSSGVVN